MRKYNPPYIPEEEKEKIIIIIQGIKTSFDYNQMRKSIIIHATPETILEELGPNAEPILTYTHNQNGSEDTSYNYVNMALCDLEKDDMMTFCKEIIIQAIIIAKANFIPPITLKHYVKPE